MIPANFAQTMFEVYGEEGNEWLNQLPALISSLEQQWSLHVLPPFTPLTYNYVAPAIHAGGESVVLKVGFPSREFFSKWKHYAFTTARASSNY